MSNPDEDEKNSEYLIVDNTPNKNDDASERERTPMESDDGDDLEYDEAPANSNNNREDTVSIKSDHDEETKNSPDESRSNGNASSTGTGPTHARSGAASAPASNHDVMSLFRVNSAHDRSSSATLPTKSLELGDGDSNDDDSSSESDEDLEQQEQRNSQVMFVRAAQTWMSEKADLEEELIIEREQLEDQRARGEYLEGQVDAYKRRLSDMEKEKDKYVDMYGKLSEQYLDLVTRHDELIEDRQIAAAVAANVDDGVFLHKNPSVQSDVVVTHRRNRSRSLGDKEIPGTLVHSWSPQMGQFTLLQRELEMKTEQLDAGFQKVLLLLTSVKNLQTSLEQEGGIDMAGGTATSGATGGKLLTDRAAIRRTCIRRAFECAKVQKTLEATNMLLESYIRRYPTEGSYEIVENLERGDEYMYQLFYDELKETRLLCTDAFQGMNDKFEYFDNKMGNMGDSVSGVMRMIDEQSQVNAKASMQTGSDLQKVQRGMSTETEKLRDSFESSLNHLRADLNEMNKRNDDLNGKLTERDHEINRLRKEREELAEELEGLKLSKCEAIRHVASEMDRLRSRIKKDATTGSSSSSGASGLAAVSAGIKVDDSGGLLGTMASSLTSLWK